jgi:hypothetical protein
MAGMLVEGLLGQKVPKILGHVPCRRVTLRGPLREGLQTNAVQFLRDTVVNLPWRPGFLSRDLFQQFDLRLATKRLTADK